MRVQQVVLVRVRGDGAIHAEKRIGGLEYGFIRGEGVFLIAALVSGVRINRRVVLGRREDSWAQRRGIYAERHDPNTRYV